MASAQTPADVRVKSVLVAYDFSQASRKPLRHALAIARHYSAKFYFMHVVSSIGYTIAGPPSLHLAIESTRREMHTLIDELHGGGELAGLQYEFLLEEGDVWQRLHQIIREKQVDAVVVGTHGRGGVPKLVLGSIAEQIFRQAECLVLTVGPGSYEDPIVDKVGGVRPFLFATDFGPASVRALPYAISFAEQFGAKLVLLHVLPPAPIPEGFHWSTTGDLPQMREAASVAAIERLRRLVAHAGPMTVEPEFMVKFGRASEQILLAARTLDADTIVLGLNRSAHPETVSHLHGAVAYPVVCAAHCPVLTLKH